MGSEGRSFSMYFMSLTRFTQKLASTFLNERMMLMCLRHNCLLLLVYFVCTRELLLVLRNGGLEELCLERYERQFSPVS